MARPPEERAGVADAALDGTTALVTGSTSGIGRAAALSLGRLGATVFVHGRDEAAGAEVVDDLDAVGADAQFVRADFADLGAVEELAATVRADTDGLDLLINNAGGLFREGRLTDAGVEYTVHVNHLAPYLLTVRLLDHVSAGGRIVTTASAAHQGGSFDLDAATSLDDYSAAGAYARSKLANVQFALELSERLRAAGREVTSNAVHPGAVPGSGFSRFLPAPLPSVVQLFDGLPLVTGVDDGAAALVRPAVDDRLDGVSGRYFSKQRAATPSEAARDPTLRRHLWEWSAEAAGIDEPLAAAQSGDD